MVSLNRRGVFISFEGGEGAGKSTLMEEVAHQLASEGYRIVKTREPGGTYLGEHIRTLLLDYAPERSISPHAELCLFLAARAQQIQEIISPALQERKIVLCDRFNDSTIAYQGVARGLGVEAVEQFCEFICQGVQPHLTLYLDIEPEIGLSRARRDQPFVAGARGYDRIESEGLGFHTKIREAFHAIYAKKKKPFYLLDAAQPRELVQAQAIKLIHQLLQS